jgi:hypothetical protein
MKQVQVAESREVEKLLLIEIENVAVLALKV